MDNNLSVGQKSIEGKAFAKKVVVVRVDYDVLLENGEIVDSTKIQASVETIKYLQEQNAKVVIISHLGDPKGEEVDELSLMNARFELGKLLNKPVKFAHITACENSIKFMEFGEILLLENLKFHSEEYAEDARVKKDFMSVLIKMADAYVNEAFGVSKALASMSELSSSLESYFGFNYIKEIESIQKVLNGNSPSISIIGGSDISTRLYLMELCLNFSDRILVGGLVAMILLAAQGVEAGNYSFSQEDIKLANEILKKSQNSNVEIILPVDYLGAKEENSTEVTEIHTQNVPKELQVFDIGQNTLTLFRETIESAETVFWSGPLGYYENDLFNKGTEAIGEYIALSTPKSTFRYALGASTSMAMTKLKIKHKRFSHVSLGTSQVFDILKSTKI